MFSAAAAVYRRALGDDFPKLDPVLQRYFGPVPVGAVGRGTGTFSFVGPVHPLLLRVPLLLLARRRILFPEQGRNIPFSVENRPTPDGGLVGIRRFHFPHRTRIMQDVMRAGPERTIIERLGRNGELEVELTAEAVDGGLRLRSGSLALRVRGLRVPIPPFASVTVSEDADPADPDGQLVDVRLATLLLGEVFRYTGRFHYRIEHDGGQGLPAVGAPL